MSASRSRRTSSWDTGSTGPRVTGIFAPAMSTKARCPMSLDAERVEKAVRELLEAVGEDPDREGLQATPRRVASMYAELFSGVAVDPAKNLQVTFQGQAHE